VHPLIRRTWEGVNRVLSPLDVAIVRRSAAEALGYKVERRPPRSQPELPPDAPVLRPDDPHLAELEARYRGHPAAGTSEWSSSYLDPRRIFPHFRADSPYVWQQEGHACLDLQYALTTLYVEHHDPLRLLDRLEEDGAFGARTVWVAGRLVSRDLLDSIIELTFLEEEAAISSWDAPTILDIGAGYGRLAHRGSVALPTSRWLCADAIPLSTFLCRYYLDFRRVERAEAVALDAVEEVVGSRRIDLAVNVHSFSECSIEAIAWWLDVLVAADVRRLMIVPNTGEQLLSTEAFGRKDFLPLLSERGFVLTTKREKYAHSPSAQAFGVIPSWHLLFERT
jgi:hypothetical protein